MKLFLINKWEKGGAADFFEVLKWLVVGFELLQEVGHFSESSGEKFCNLRILKDYKVIMGCSEIINYFL